MVAPRNSSILLLSILSSPESDAFAISSARKQITLSLSIEIARRSSARPDILFCWLHISAFKEKRPGSRSPDEHTASFMNSPKLRKSICPISSVPWNALTKPDILPDGSSLFSVAMIWYVLR